MQNEPQNTDINPEKEQAIMYLLTGDAELLSQLKLIYNKKPEAKPADALRAEILSILSGCLVMLKPNGSKNVTYHNKNFQVHLGDISMNCYELMFQLSLLNRHIILNLRNSLEHLAMSPSNYEKLIRALKDFHYSSRKEKKIVDLSYEYSIVKKIADLEQKIIIAYLSSLEGPKRTTIDSAAGNCMANLVKLVQYLNEFKIPIPQNTAVIQELLCDKRNRKPLLLELEALLKYNQDYVCVECKKGIAQKPRAKTPGPGAAVSAKIKAPIK